MDNLVSSTAQVSKPSLAAAVVWEVALSDCYGKRKERTQKSIVAHVFIITYVNGMEYFCVFFRKLIGLWLCFFCWWW